METYEAGYSCARARMTVVPRRCNAPKETATRISYPEGPQALADMKRPATGPSDSKSHFHPPQPPTPTRWRLALHILFSYLTTPLRPAGRNVTSPQSVQRPRGNRPTHTHHPPKPTPERWAAVLPPLGLARRTSHPPSTGRRGPDGPRRRKVCRGVDAPRGRTPAQQPVPFVPGARSIRRLDPSTAAEPPSFAVFYSVYRTCSRPAAVFTVLSKAIEQGSLTIRNPEREARNYRKG